MGKSRYLQASKEHVNLFQNVDAGREVEFLQTTPRRRSKAGTSEIVGNLQSENPINDDGSAQIDVDDVEMEALSQPEHEQVGNVHIYKFLRG